jgi:hypothetical protein
MIVGVMLLLYSGFGLFVGKMTAFTEWGTVALANEDATIYAVLMVVVGTVLTVCGVKNFIDQRN